MFWWSSVVLWLCLAYMVMGAEEQHRPKTPQKQLQQLQQEPEDSGYEIKTLSGQPDYKSINLTWEVVQPSTTENPITENTLSPNRRAFTIRYCELQSFGPHRCKSKAVTATTNVEDKTRFSTTIRNLRMATQYSVNVQSAQSSPDKASPQRKTSGRSEFTDDDHDANEVTSGESIIIPTKGFSAHATQCLHHASEIEVETGPFFAGKIEAEGGGADCSIEGDPRNSRTKYMMRIDHEKCGSRVNQETLTVETFITVQENLGILTHSTRRFVVVCTFQPEIMTVRASFRVPGRAGVVQAEPYDEDSMSGGRSSRQRKFKMVDKSALVLKEDPTVAAPIRDEGDNDFLGQINEIRKAKFAPLVHSRESVHLGKSNTSGMVIALALSAVIVAAFATIIFTHRKRPPFLFFENHDTS